MVIKMLKIKKSKRAISLILALAIVINVVFLVSTYIFIGQAKKALYDEKVNYMKEISLKTSQNISSYIDGYITTVDAIAAFISTHESRGADHIISILQTEAVKNDFKRMGIIDTNGISLSTDNITMDLSDRSYFQEAMNGRSAVSDKLLIDKADGGEINVVSSPIFENGKVSGAIFATKTQDAFAEILKTESFGGEGYSYIITSDGSPVIRTTHPNCVGDYTNLFEEIKNREISN